MIPLTPFYPLYYFPLPVLIPSLPFQLLSEIKSEIFPYSVSGASYNSTLYTPQHFQCCQPLDNPLAPIDTLFPGSHWCIFSHIKFQTNSLRSIHDREIMILSITLSVWRHCSSLLVSPNFTVDNDLWSHTIPHLTLASSTSQASCQLPAY